MAELEYPSTLRYTAEHEWARVDGEEVVVGITAFAQDSLGDVVFVDLPEVGTEVEPGQSCGEIESTKSVSDLYAPVRGTVTRVNAALEDSPDNVNSDPYGEGWLYAVTPADSADVDALLDADAYQAQLD
ncbi:MAG: glycine cleavage system protein GcvH [Actinomycetales bacterium]